MARDDDDPLTAVLGTFRDPCSTDWGNAWCGMEPTFQSRKSVRKWQKMAARPGGEDAYFLDSYMLGTQREVARAIARRYEARREAGARWCVFDRVIVDEDLDQWKVRRQNLVFRWAGDQHEPFTVRFSLDPETFEYSVKPVPIAWLYDERFVRFLEDVMWRAPRRHGLAPSVAHGGAQFSLSAKSFLDGSLLADDIATKLNLPQLSTWILDWPNPDDRAFRASRRRKDAFADVLGAYWAGAFHPRARAVGPFTVENAYLDQGFVAQPSPPPDLMDRARGPRGDGREVFQTNFALGRAVRLQAQAVEPGYWQAAHPDEDGYRPDQIMRYSEGNLNRLQIAGEFHVKSGKVLQAGRAPELDAPLDPSMLTDEASWENRGQMGRSSARDFVEAVLLDVHHARYLQAHPHVVIRQTLLQDQLLGDGVETVRRHGPPGALGRLRAEARRLNLEAGRGRLHSDWIEPETLLWAAWGVLPAGERAAIACEIIDGFVERVEQAAAHDPRTDGGDPMEWHRHRIHPLLWKTIDRGALSATHRVRRELDAFTPRAEEYLARRPIFSHVDLVAPWEGL